MNRPTLLHLGLGAFHRAHQAVVMQRLHDTGDHRWRLIAGNLRDDQAAVEAGLLAQHGAYTLETVTPGGIATWQHVTAIARVLPYAADHAALIAAGADPATRIISWTVTEAGYAADAVLYAVLAEILRERRLRDAGPVTLLCCDNLRHSGDRSREGLLEYLSRHGDAALRHWVEMNTRSPNAMVDRITPRPPTGLRERVREATGRDDRVPVMAESFLQWVIEDDFIAGRPDWEKAGVEMVSSVAPYEEAKIRLLNATHSALAWGGALVGHDFIHQAARDPRLRAIADAYARWDAIPCLLPSPLDLTEYLDTVLDRFGNAALADTVARVAADGYAKLPGFILPTIRERLAAGASIANVARLPALLLAFLQRWNTGALPFVHHDQAMEPARVRAIFRSGDALAAFCAEPMLFGELAGDARLLAALRVAALEVARLEIAAPVS